MHHCYKKRLYHISHICIQMQSITAVLTDCIAKFNTYDTTKHNHDYNMNVQQQKNKTYKLTINILQKIYIF